MIIPDYKTGKNHLSIQRFQEMDYLAVSSYQLPIELMMENAGLQLATLVANIKPEPCNVVMGVGKGNNGGGGLVAARRLAAWGYKVVLDIPDNNLKPLPRLQKERAEAFGVKEFTNEQPDIFVDTYLGFSQRLPLADNLLDSVRKANNLNCTKISLDIPVGFDKNTGSSIFNPDIVMTLAAMKTELLKLPHNIQVYLADLGIPLAVYNQFAIEQPPFSISPLLRLR